MSSAFATKLMARSVLAFISCLLLIHNIPVVSAADQFEIVITTSEAVKGTVGEISLALQTETAGTVLSFENEGPSVALNKVFTFNSTVNGIGADVCFMQLWFGSGSAKEWSVQSVTVQSTLSKNAKKVTFEVNKTAQINEMLVLDNCKQRQES